MIGGYVMISADSIDEAAELARGCPVHFGNPDLLNHWYDYGRHEGRDAKP